MSSMPGGRRQKGGKKYAGKRKSEKPQYNSTSGYDKDSGQLIKEVAKAQDSDVSREKKVAKVKNQGMDTDREERLDPLTPIREFEEEEDENGIPLGKTSLDYLKSYASLMNKKHDMREVSYNISK